MKTTLFKTRSAVFFCTLAAVFLLSAGRAFALENAIEAAPPAAPPTLWVVGDSTAAAFEDNYFYPRYGWGTQLNRYFQGIRIENLSVPGASSQSFLTTSQYQTLLNGMQAGDYLLIAFGHNDERPESNRYTNPNGTIDTPGSFPYYLSKYYIRPAREKMVIPLLCTPIVRRDPGGRYDGESGHITPDRTVSSTSFPGGDYPEAIRQAGTACQVPVLDLTRCTREFYEQLGPVGTLYCHAWVSCRNVSVDNTHTNLYGAACNAWFIADELSRTNCDLKNHLIANPLPPDPSILTVNPAYHDDPFVRPTGDSTRWENAGPWKATVFGDIGEYEYLNSVYFNLYPQGDGGLRISAGQFSAAGTVLKTGGISPDTDGIAMYYQAVPASSRFTFSADVTIHQLDPDDGASFGLMVRDDIYLDTVVKDLLGDYVAAGPLMMSSSPWNCFARKSGILTPGGAAARLYGAGETVHMEIHKGPDGYTCCFGDNPPVSAGFDFPLTARDPEFVYVGMFAARSADVSFQNVNLIFE